MLPPGWHASRFNMLPGGGQLEYRLKDTVLANAYYQPEYEDRSSVWPAAYQNQGSFKPYYHKPVGAPRGSLHGGRSTRVSQIFFILTCAQY